MLAMMSSKFIMEYHFKVELFR